MEVKTWTRRCLKAFMEYNEKKIRKLLFKKKAAGGTIEEVKTQVKEVLTDEFEVQDGDSEIWVVFLSEHICMKARKHQIFRHLFNAFQGLVKIYKEEDEGYRYFGIIKEYSKKLLKEGSKVDGIKEVINAFRLLLAACQNNKPLPNSQVVGLIFSINISIKACFRLNNLQQMTSLLRIVNNEHSRFPKLEAFPKSEQVELKFYEGKFYIFENRIQEAARCLRFAFEGCHKGSMKNKRIILRYLVPINLLFGKYPTEKLLEKYDLSEFKQLIAWVRLGNVAEIQRNIDKNQIAYIKQGTLVAMETLKLLGYRNLFKRVFQIIRAKEIPMKCFTSAMALIDLDNATNLKCISVFNNLISRDWIKATMRLVTNTIEFKENAFPRIAFS